MIKLWVLIMNMSTLLQVDTVFCKETQKKVTWVFLDLEYNIMQIYILLAIGSLGVSLSLPSAHLGQHFLSSITIWSRLHFSWGQA